MRLEEQSTVICILSLYLLSALVVTSVADVSTIEVGTAAVARSQFPPDFIFGSAISSYQSEGAAMEDGKGQSIWDFYTHKHPERIKDGSNGDLAADSYHLYKKDIKLLKDMGMTSYRISISWPRILPTGKLADRVNQRGIQFYNDMINEMLAQGITPFITIFHWDLPQPLQEEYGGFLSNRVVNDFREFANICFREYGDRVKHWITINEPHSIARGAYSEGEMAPGRCTSTPERKCEHGNSGTEPYIVAHNLLLAHAAAAQLYKENYQVGIALNSNWYVPYNETSPKDEQAVIRGLDFVLGWFLEPITRGDYPQSMKTLVGDRLPTFTADESKQLKGSIDFLGLNYYTAFYAADLPASPNVPKLYKFDPHIILYFDRNGLPIGPPTAASWLSIYPKGIRELILYIRDNYNNPLIFITENGCPDNGTYPGTGPGEPPKDLVRIEYHSSHLNYLNMAMKEGGNVKGYFAWSLLDNFEWAEGYTMRFGLNYVDFKHPSTRVPKESAFWFRNFLQS
ncbi:Beta-glucosidase 24 [Linum perenne]